MIEGPNHIELKAMGAKIIPWLYENLLNIGTVYQGILIAAAFLFASIVYKLIRKPIRDSIDQSKMPAKVKRTVRNIQRLLFPFIALITIFVLTRIVSSEMVGMNVGLTDGIMKVVLAWILIKIIVQFIDHSSVRNIFALTIWGVATLSIFGILDETTKTLDAVGMTFGEFHLSALVIIKGTIYLFILLYMASFASSFVERQVLKSANITRSSQVLIAKIIRIFLIVFALLIGLANSGIDLSLFAVFGGAIGLGLGLGLQRGVANLFSGLLLLFDGSIQPGDVIELEQSGTFGWVRTMGSRSIEIVTRDNKSYLVPNEEFVNQRVVNWSHGDSNIRLAVDFGIDYKCDPHKVIDIALAAVKKPERVLITPEPVCWLAAFGDSALNFSLRFWIKDAQNGLDNIKGEVLLALWDAFKEHGITIPYPHREIYLHTAKD